MVLEHQQEHGSQWNEVHALLASDAIDRRRETNRRMRTPALLRGLLFLPDGQRLVPSHTVKKGKTYRYYSPSKRRCFGAWASQHQPLPAVPIEELVTQQIVAALSAPHIVQSVWDRVRAIRPDLSEPEVVLPMRNLGNLWQQLFPAEQCRLAQLLIERVIVADDGDRLARSGLAGSGRRVDARHHRRRAAGTGAGRCMTTRVQVNGAAMPRERRDGEQIRLSTFISCRIEKRLVREVVVRPDGAASPPGMVASGSEIARREGLHHSTVNELMRLTLPEPAIIQAIVSRASSRAA